MTSPTAPTFKNSADRAAITAPAARWALASLSLSMLLSSLGTSIANVGLPVMARVFSASFSSVQWIVLAYLLALTSLIVGAGRLGDMMGRRRLLLVGVGVFTFASTACGVAPSLPLLVAARAVQGLGAALMMALTLAFVGEIVPRAKIGRAMGLLGTMSALGTALGPSLGGFLVSGFGWRALFLINLPLGLTALAFARRHLPADRRGPEAGRASFDVPGTVLLSCALVAYALAVTVGRGAFGVVNAALLLVAAAAAAVFVFVQTRAASPLVQLSRLREPALGTSLGLSALVSTVLMATLVVGPFHLSRALGLTPVQAGIALSAGPLAAALMGLPAGRAVDRLGPPRVTLLGLTAIAAGCVALATAPAVFGVAGYLAPVVVITAGYALFQAANNTAVMNGVGPQERGVVSGLLNLSRHLGLITGAAVMGAVFAAATGTHDFASAAPSAVAAGTRMTFACAAIVTALAAAVGGRVLLAGSRSAALAPVALQRNQITCS
jgi:EmrB/QacA subfamily drug resistance transporter